MEYIYEKEDKNYEDFSSGRVLYNQKGTTAFPVRLASEIFCRAEKYLKLKGIEDKISIYDPCCGGAYLLTALGFLHSQKIAKIFASDVNGEVVELAKRNLSLLTEEGMMKRISEIDCYIKEFNKISHKMARESAENLHRLISPNRIKMQIFCADVLQLNGQNSYNFSVDLVITDLPYGNIVEWSNKNNDVVGTFFDNISTVLNPNGIVTVVSDKKSSIKSERFKRLEHFQIGKRKVAIFEIAAY